MQAAAAIVSTLKSHGVTYYFSVPGGQPMAVIEAVYQDPDLHFVTMRHENSALCAADGFYRATGKMAAAIVTTGPGLTNAITGLGGALRDNSALFLISGNNNRAILERDALQEADHTAITRPVVKASRFVTVPERAAEAAAELCRHALRGRNGPVHLDAPMDVLEADVEDLSVRNSDQHYFAPMPSDDAVDYLAQVLSDVPKAMLWLGGGVLRGHAVSEWEAIRQRLNLAAITSYNGIGAAPWPARGVFGPRSGRRTRLSNRVLEEAELVVVLGSRLGGQTTTNWTAKLPPRIIQIDIESEVLGRHYDLEAAICADTKLAGQRLLRALEHRPVSSEVATGRAAWIDSLHAYEEDWNTEIHGLPRPGDISPLDVVEELQGVLQANADTLFVAGAGNSGIWCHLLQTGRTQFFQKPVGFGNMGFEIPAALGAALGASRPVICSVGDGSANMSIMELTTIAQNSAPVTVVVWNDKSYGNIRQYQEAFDWNASLAASELGGTDFAAVALGMGVQATRVDTVMEFRDALGEAVQSGEPRLIEVPLPSSPNVWEFPF